jgi:hypothetical protein
MGSGIASPQFTTDAARQMLSNSTGHEGQISPAIIPPMLGKTSVAPVIPLQWKATINALARARKVWVIGYSFPTTDTFMNRLLCEGIQDNNDLHKFVIVDIQSYDQWRARVEDLFPPIMRDTKVEFLSMRAGQCLHQLREDYGRSDFWDRIRQESNTAGHVAWSKVKYP